MMNSPFRKLILLVTALWSFALPCAVAQGTTAADAGASPTARLNLRVGVPADAGPVFLIAAVPEVKSWKLGATRLQGDGTTRTLSLDIPAGKSFEYRFHRGSWEMLGVDELGGLLPPRKIVIEKETTVSAVVPGFRKSLQQEFGADEKAAADDGISPLVFRSPLPWQVFQRQRLEEGDIVVTGTLRVPCDVIAIECRKGTDLLVPVVRVSAKSGAKSFKAAMTLPAGGWYSLTATAYLGGKVVATANVDHFGIGEVFVGAGQSNSTNCGQYRINQSSGMVSSFGGTFWRIANDPQPGPHDKSLGGSFWPAFGDAMYAKYKVPIGVATTGHGGTTVKKWNTGGELYAWTLTRVRQLGPHGFRAVLWHQGESDARAMPPEEYYDRMKTLIQDLKRDAGWDVPWVTAQVSYHNPKNSSWPGIRAAQQRLWNDGISIEGPDTDTLTGANRDYDGAGIHFSALGLHAHGKMWAEKVAKWMDGLPGLSAAR